MQRKPGDIMILLSLIGVFLFSCATYINSYVVETSLLNKGISVEDTDYLEHVEMLGYVICAFVLTQFIHTKYINIVPIISIILLGIGTLSVIFINNYNLLQINALIIATGIFGYGSVIFIKIIEYPYGAKYLFLSLSLFIWILGHNTVDLFVSKVLSMTDISTSCTLVYILVMSLTLLNNNLTNNFIKKDFKFSALISGMELELLTAFTVSYLTFDMLWYYTDFAVKEKLAISDFRIVLYYMLQGALFSVLPISYLISKVNKYLANTLFTSVLLISFLVLPIHGANFANNVYLIWVIGTCLSAIFVCNILILTDKFRGRELRSAVFIYFLACVIGINAGTLSSYVPFEVMHGRDFLFSLCSVTGSFILYYLWCVIARRLFSI